MDAALGAVLPPGSLYAVGGRVRDEIRSRLDGVARPAKDLDYVVVGVPLADLLERVRAAGRADVVGASFAVLKVTVGAATADVALPRRERSTGVGHREFAVESGPDVPLQDDLSRRDFRMNMIARRIGDSALVDPYGGEADIAAGRIDLLSAAAFEEDPLRMLRACQFAARFGYALTERTLAAMRAAAPLADTVSPERIRDELLKLLTAPKPSAGLELMRETGILGAVLPELLEGVGVEQNEWHAYDVYRHNLETLDAAPQADALLRVAALLHDVGKPRVKDGPHFYRHEQVGEAIARERLEALRFPGDVVETVAQLIRHHMYAADPAQEAKTIRRFIRRIGPERLERQFALRAADIAGSGLPKRDDSNERFQERVTAIVAERPPLGVRDLAIGGAEVIAAAVAAGALPKGSRGGPIVGRTLEALLGAVLDDPAANEPAVLAEMAARFVSGGMVDPGE